MAKKLIYIFTLAFLLNLIWENFHSVLYIHYKGGEITEWTLLRAALFDAIVITAMAIPLFKFLYLRNKKWIALILGIMAAILIEWHALGTNRWNYNSAMPIIPILKTGLTPTIQLGTLSYLIYKIVDRKQAN